jgi:hypothetical protein
MGDGIKRGKATDESLGHLSYWLAKRCPQLSGQDCERLLQLEFPNREAHHWLTIQSFAAYRGSAHSRPAQLGVRTEEKARAVLARIDNKVGVLRRLFRKVSSTAVKEFNNAINEQFGSIARVEVRHRIVEKPMTNRQPLASEEKRLLPDEADNDLEFYQPQAGDRRLLVARQIRQRRGQQAFRNKLRRRYGNRCMITGCELLDVLEAGI